MHLTWPTFWPNSTMTIPLMEGIEREKFRVQINKKVGEGAKLGLSSPKAMISPQGALAALLVAVVVRLPLLNWLLVVPKEHWPYPKKATNHPAKEAVVGTTQGNRQ